MGRLSTLEPLRINRKPKPGSRERIKMETCCVCRRQFERIIDGLEAKLAQTCSMKCWEKLNER